MAVGEGSARSVMQIVLETQGEEDAVRAADAIGRIKTETHGANQAQQAFSKGSVAAIQAVNKVQNAFFHAAFYAAKFAGANSQVANTLTAIAFGADVAIGVLQSYMAISKAMRAAKAAETVPLTTAAVAQTGAAAPLLGPAIVATIIGAGAAVAAFLSTQGGPSAAYGMGPISKPTKVTVGDSPWNPEWILNSEQLRDLAGPVVLQMDSRAVEDALTIKARLNQRSGVGA